jgi:thiol-disulfide isomerase/thioredoxin
MRSSLVLLTLLLVAPAAHANGFDRPAPPLAELLARARAAKKPLLLDFSAVWCQPCKLLDAELDKPENQQRLERFVFQPYDAERGAGAEAAARFGVTGYPTLLVVDENGAVLGQKVGFDSDGVSPWLETQARALRTEAELEAQLRARPDDVDAMWLLSRRATARGDAAAARAWMSKIEAADRSADRAEAAAAAWQRMESELDEKLRRDVRAQTAAYLEKYPAHGDRALKAYAAAGASKAEVEAALARMIAAISDPGALNDLSYLALSLGALDGAKAAAEKLVSLTPDDAGAIDTLAEVQSYRGERERAVETANRAIARAGDDANLATELRANLERYRVGAPSPGVAAPGVLASPLAPARPPAATRITPEIAAQRLYAKNAGQVTAACRPSARGLGEVYVRVHVGEAKVERVEVLEPSASPRLRRCVDKAVRAIAVPADQKATRVIVPIKMGA